MTVPLQEALPPTPPLTDDLIQAARYGDKEEVQAILAQGISIDSHDRQGRTALHMAAANGHLDIVQLLVEAGSNVNALNMEDNSPLHYASLNGHIEVIQELILKGANPAALNRHERTPIDEALGRNNQAAADAVNAAAVACSLDATSMN